MLPRIQLKHFLTFQTLIALFILASSCKNNDAPIPTKLSLIAKGSLLGFISNQEDRSISNQSDWTNFINDYNDSFETYGGHVITETTIDFSRYQVIVVFDGIKGETGYSIDIIGFEEREDQVIVEVKHTVQKKIDTEMVTQSYCITKIPKFDKPLVFDHKAISPNIYPNLIGKGATEGNESLIKQDIVITNSEHWDSLREKMNETATVDFLTLYPDIDFSQFMVIASFEKFDCEYPACSSITVDITDVVENETNITVTIQNLLVSVIPGYSQPFHIVYIPRSTKDIVFEHK